MLPFVACLVALNQSELVPTEGLTITRSVKLRPGTYYLPSPEGEAKAGDETIPTFTPAIKIQGRGITVDFAGVVLKGSSGRTAPDERRGLAIEVEGEEITLKNVEAHGYRVAIRGRHTRGLRILGGDLSYNFRQHLLSTPERENEADWMSYHHNEHDEWLRYGAAMYIRDCNELEVKGVRVTGGQNALMMTQSDRGLIWNNDFRFNSGIGLGMYRSSANRIMHNRIDWNVRGFSYGVYNRGQDSAGILIYEQSNQNTFAYNSVTHGGDGFFLWAGQSTMDTGKGGCNDNLVYANDFSHAPTNGIEATFSRNYFINNIVHECAHGVWGGFSHHSQFDGNDFADNQAAIAIEHGQANFISRNRFRNDDVAISLWANPSVPADWGYGKVNETQSKSNVITENHFTGNGLAIDLRRSEKTLISQNTMHTVGQSLRSDGSTVWISGTRLSGGTPPVDPKYIYEQAPTKLKGPNWNVPKLRGGLYAMLPKDALRGWKYILVDDWGPYDFRRPLLWPERKPLSGEAPRPGADSAVGSGRRPKPAPTPKEGPVRYELLGPKGAWRLVSAKGVKVGENSGTVPGWVTVEELPNEVGTTELMLEYTGAETVDSWGNVTPAGRPVRFGFSKFRAPIDWDVKIFPWSKSVNPAEPHAVPDPAALATALAGAPVATAKLKSLGFATAGSFLPGAPRDHFATLANGEFTIPEGDYLLDVTTDDGIRVYLDDRLVLESWQYQGPTPYAARVHLGGHHRIRVEHFEIDGYSALQVRLKPASTP